MRTFIDGRFIPASFEIENGRFSSIVYGEDSDDIVLPGLVDIHTHGAAGADFSDGDYEGLVKIGRYLASNGVTSFVPTSMTLPYDVLGRAFSTAREYVSACPENASRIAGIHMEGPYFSEKKKGAQNSDYLKLPDYDGFKALYDGCGGLIRIVDVAPELEGAASFTEKASSLCTVSVAHTDASYEEAKAVFDAGASHLTHLYNGMPGIHHRKPGVIGAASENERVTAELIGDGLHVHESAMRMAFKLFPDRICLISDSLRCAGMPDGELEIGGQTAYLKDNIARLADGTIAGSATNLFVCMKNAVRFGLPLEKAVRAATEIPAREIGRDSDIGSIAEGKFADYIVCDRDLNLKEVYIGGIRVS